MVLFQESAWVWFQHPTDAFIPVRMIVQSGDKILARAGSGEQYQLDVSQQYSEVHPSSLKPVENMVTMEELSEPAILHNLRLRFEENTIYTYISSILVSINPFKMLPCYGPAIMSDYRSKMSRMESCAPHVYALADNAYKNLRTDNMNQSVIISGESGAGKTEATKLVLQYMAEMSGQGNDVEQQLLSSNPIIEAFGNAKTVRNNNSSRFGKWVEIRFNDRYHIIGADIKNYLLEKSRIVLPGAGERNYHLFYQICAGASASEREKWRLDHATKFKILSVGGTLEVEGIDDAEEYRQLRSALDILHFTPIEVDDIMRTTSACLHLGNVEFHSNAKEEALIRNQEEVDIAAGLLKVDVRALGISLISQRKQMGRDNILTVRSKLMAEAARDALTKKIYSNMFNWLIERINKTLGKHDESSPIPVSTRSSTSTYAPSARCVGVLDIFGFEIFQLNRFEQLCINFANEKMQQHFNAHIFEMEQREYVLEKIDVAHVSYIDNQPCLDLIENGKTSILLMADEELKLPGGSDENLLSRMHVLHASASAPNRYYIKPKTGIPQFGINHYAGPVDYTMEGFCDKNRDSLEPNISEVIQASASPFVAALIPVEVNIRTLGSQFKSQLSTLMDTLNSTSPHFIRCVKSNSLKVSDTFDSILVLRQLRYLGLKEVVNIRQLGYPIRRLHRDFIRRYGMLVADGQAMAVLAKKGAKADYASMCKKLLDVLPNVTQAEWRVGETKTFLKQSLSTILEQQRERKLTKIAILLQSLARTKIWRRRFLRVKGAIAELKRCMKDPASTPEIIDAAINTYESLRFKTDAQLIQEAITIRNRLFEQRQALRAIDAAMKSMDLETMNTAIIVAEKSGLNQQACEPFARLKVLYTKGKELRKQLEVAVKARSIQELTTVLNAAQTIGLAGKEETQARALLHQLEEELRTQLRLQEEQKQREIEGFRRAIQVAMNAKSGQMLDAACKAAIHSKYQMENDPLVIEGLKLVATLDKEVKAFTVAQELKAAIESDDRTILQNTIQIAMDKGFASHALCVQAKELLVKLNKKHELLQVLVQAVQQRNEGQIKQALQTVTTPQNQKEFPTLLTSPEYQMAQQLLADLAAQRTKVSSASADASAQASAHAISSLRMAIDSQNQALLENAIQGAKLAGYGKDSTHEGSDVFHQAVKMLAQVSAHAEIRQQELLNAAAQVGRRRSIIGKNDPFADTEYNILHSASFDPDVYRRDEYQLAFYPDLRSVNDFSSDRKSAKTGMLKHSKEVIPKSLMKFECAHEGYGRGSVATIASGNEWSERFLNEKSIELFKMIQGFMLDRSYSFPDTLVTELFSEILLYPALRTEVYAQLVKQLTHNIEHVESYTRGWMLFCLLTDAVPPLSTFINFVMHFIDEQIAGKYNDLAASPEHIQIAKNYGSYALHKLQKTHKSFRFAAPKKDSPELNTALLAKEAGQPIPALAPFVSLTSVDHITAFRERSMIPAPVTIHFTDGTSITLTVNPWQTNAEIVDQILTNLGMKDQASYFGIYEMRGIDLVYLYASDNLLDVQIAWSRFARREEIKKKQGFFSSLFGTKAAKKEDDYDEWAANPGIRRFLLKRRVYSKALSSPDPAFAAAAAASLNPMSHKELFWGTQREIAYGQHAIEEDPCVKISAIAKNLASNVQMTGPIGPTPRQKSPEENDVFSHIQLHDCPPPLLKKIDAKKFGIKVDKMADSYTLKAATLETWLLDAKAVPTFGCGFYDVVRNEDPSIPLKISTELTVGINYFGLRILDKKTKQIIDHFPLLNILGWSSSPIRFVVKVKLNKPIGAGITTVTFRFNTYNPRMGKEMCDLLYAYATEMMKTVNEMKKR